MYKSKLLHFFLHILFYISNIVNAVVLRHIAADVFDEGDKIGRIFNCTEGVFQCRGDLKDGEVVMGYPAMDSKTFMKSSAIMRRLPEMYKDLNDLKKQMNTTKK